MHTNTVSREALKAVLEAHEAWLRSKGATGKRADLRSTVLRRIELPQANLSQALLDTSDLSEASLPGADLSGASLIGANLAGACFTGANFSRARLEDADLAGADLTRSDFSGTRLNRTWLRQANLQEVDLTGAVGLSMAQLSGTNVCGAKLPEGLAKFESLAHVEELSKKTGTLLTAMLTGCVYAWLTIATTTDAQLLTNSRTSPLPIIQADIPIAGFYWLAPAALVALYTYFHLYLLRLWKYLADLPAIFPDGRSLYERAYPWLPNGIVRSFIVRLKSNRSFISTFEVIVSAILVWWLVPSTLVLFWLRYLPRHDWHGSAAHIVVLGLAVASAMWLQAQTRAMFQGHREVPHHTHRKRVHPFLRATVLHRGMTFLVSGGLVGLLAFIVTDGAINHAADSSESVPHGRSSENGSPWIVARSRSLVPRALQWFGFRGYADLTEQDVSSKPANWFMRDETELIRIVHGAQLKRADLRRASAKRAFLVKADLREANLRHAKLVEAQLQGADLRGAHLDQANLRRAYLQGARLGVLRDANTRLLIEKTQELLERSVTALEKLADSEIAQVRVTQQSLEIESQLMKLEEDEELQPTDLRWANLNLADLTDADLRGAHLENAVLIGAQLTRTKLVGAVLRQADLSRAHLYKADLRAAIFSGATLRETRFQSADLEYAIDLTQEQLDVACIDKDTRLPSHLTRPKPCVGMGQ